MPKKKFNLELTASEAVLMLVGVRLVNEVLESIQIQGQDMDEEAIGILVHKLEVVLGEDFAHMSEEIVEDLLNSFLPESSLNPFPLPAFHFNYPMYAIDNKLPVIERAIEKKRVLEIEYYSVAKEDVQTHMVEPLALEQRDDIYVMVAHCRLRNDIRVFRVDRIKSLHMIKETFLVPKSFKVADFKSEEPI